MRVVIPAKAESTRCKDKNWRKFHEEKCLVDILIEKLLRCEIDAQDIFVSSDSQELLQGIVDRYDVNAMLRPPYFARHAAPFGEVIAEMVSKFDADEDVALAHCTTPTFDEHQLVIDEWRSVNCRSIAVAQEAPTHLLIGNNGSMQPLGWSFGMHFTCSQDLMPIYQMTFSFQIMKAVEYREFRWYNAPDCHWYVPEQTHIDINSEQDFQDAQAIYRSRFG